MPNTFNINTAKVGDTVYLTSEGVLDRGRLVLPATIGRISYGGIYCRYHDEPESAELHAWGNHPEYVHLTHEAAVKAAKRLVMLAHRAEWERHQRRVAHLLTLLEREA